MRCPVSSRETNRISFITVYTVVRIYLTFNLYLNGKKTNLNFCELCSWNLKGSFVHWQKQAGTLTIGMFCWCDSKNMTHSYSAQLSDRCRYTVDHLSHLSLSETQLSDNCLVWQCMSLLMLTVPLSLMSCWLTAKVKLQLPECIL